MKLFSHLSLFLLVTCSLCSAEQETPFDYDLHYTVIPGSNPKTMVCLHGYADSHRIAKRIKEDGKLQETLVSFNFPDYDIRNKNISDKFVFGSVDELLPVLHVLKKNIIDEGLTELNLYGFSAGGGALINTIALLNTPLYDDHLKSIGIDIEGKQKILDAIQKGTIILDTPLKSVEEIIDHVGPSENLEVIAKQFRKNDLRPIDSLRHLENLSLHVILYFEVPDRVLSNRDDALYIERLKKYNAKGTTDVILGSDGGHNEPHISLWKFYTR